MQYLNKEYKECSDTLIWLGNLLQQSPGKHYSDTLSKPFYYPYIQIDAILKKDWDTLKIKVSNYLYQLSLGLDFFNNPSNYLTLLDLESLRKRFKDFYDIALKVQEEYEQLKSDEKKYLVDKVAIKKNLKLQEQIIEQNKSTLNEIGKNVESIPNEIITLERNISLQYEKLVIVESDFKNAIRRKYGECTVENLFRTVNTFVSLGRALSGDVTAIVNGVNNIDELYSSRLSNGKKGIEAAIFRIEKTVEEGESLKRNIQSAFQRFSDRKQEDRSLIAMDRQDLNKLIEEHKNLPGSC